MKRQDILWVFFSFYQNLSMTLLLKDLFNYWTYSNFKSFIILDSENGVVNKTKMPSILTELLFLVIRATNKWLNQLNKKMISENSKIYEYNWAMQYETE